MVNKRLKIRHLFKILIICCWVVSCSDKLITTTNSNLLDTNEGQSPTKPLSIQVETTDDKKKIIWFYFSDEKSLDFWAKKMPRFCNPAAVKVSSDEIERKATYDVLFRKDRRNFTAKSDLSFFVDPQKPKPTSLVDYINEFNKPFKLEAPLILKADFTKCLESKISKIANTLYDYESNCFGAVLYLKDLRPNPDYEGARSLVWELNKDSPIKTDNVKYGDVGVIFRYSSPIHAFISITGGSPDDWAFTKNGAGEIDPFIFMKIKHIQKLYKSIGSTGMEFYSVKK